MNKYPCITLPDTQNYTDKTPINWHNFSQNHIVAHTFFASIHIVLINLFCIKISLNTMLSNMKILLISIAAASTVSARSLSTPTVDCTGLPDGTFLPHPTNCAKFYVCVDEEPVQEECQPPLYFDPVLHVCNWPAAVSVGRQCRGPELLRGDQISSDYRQSGK